jgi:cytochrome o ubiquinol oxidase subunit 2
VFPAGTPVHFRLTSSGVMNSFFVPQLGSQIYTMAGMTSQLSLRPISRHLSTAVRAVQRRRLRRHVFRRPRRDAGDYAQWLAGDQGGRPDARSRGLCGTRAAQQNSRPGSYRAIDPELFDAS